MKTKTKKVGNRTEHHHWHIDMFLRELMTWLIILIVVAQVFSMISSKVTEKRHIVNNCLDECGERHFSGIQVGLDGSESACYVKEFDRTNCIKTCMVYSKLL